MSNQDDAKVVPMVRPTTARLGKPKTPPARREGSESREVDSFDDLTIGERMQVELDVLQAMAERLRRKIEDGDLPAMRTAFARIRESLDEVASMAVKGEKSGDFR